ncbi:hypothetical protein [Aureimonas leprariae]|uniref:hypothetical protein n=1 Tax=Plantimonas leprariae TaxID=2615207 RepID=UPI00138749F3|nr:hypothetical protein [Aureimonas leprariae]
MTKPASAKPSEPPLADPGLALVRALPLNAATLVHNAIMDMLRVPPLPRPPLNMPAE